MTNPSRAAIDARKARFKPGCRVELELHERGCLKVSELKNAAIYCRVARKDNGVIEQQKAELLAYAKAQGYENTTVYSDNGFSGADLNRPAFMRMERDASSGKVGTIITKNISRISRNSISLSDWLERMECCGVSFISVTDGCVDFTITDIKNTLIRNGKTDE